MSFILDLIGFVQDLFHLTKEENSLMRLVIWISVILGLLILGFYGWDYLVGGNV